MKILIINGPNLNLLGVREPDIYGKTTYSDLTSLLNEQCKTLSIECDIIQSNHEGVIIDTLHKAYFDKVDGIIINAGAYTHYSYAIRDAISSISIPTVEVHLSDITKRDEFRKLSVIKNVCVATFMGEGPLSYIKAINYLNENIKK